MTSLGEILDQIIEYLPVPKTLFEGTWFLIGWMSSYAFATNLSDEKIETYLSTNYANSPLKRVALKFLTKALNFVHHAWIGLLGVIYFGVTPIAQSINLPIYIPVVPCAELFWLCLGMAVEDIQYHLRASATDGIISKALSAIKTSH